MLGPTAGTPRLVHRQTRDSEDRRQTRAVGFEDHLTKPADSEMLNRLLTEFATEVTR